MFVRGCGKVCIARLLRVHQVLRIVEGLDSGGTVRRRQTASDELAELMRSCRGADHAVFTTEEEDALLWYFRDTWDGISLRVCAQCAVVPFMSVGFVKPSLTCLQLLVGIDLVTEREDHA